MILISDHKSLLALLTLATNLEYTLKKKRCKKLQAYAIRCSAGVYSSC